eukprot:TRINITY_DN1842_c0_g1_i1.p1 TRINITY_DN1842_c0_g1~~TRINITY_DN1842_c0_g1_i1.p1  ORF type:complete len:251 (-),score=89.85 TRINITY_DN1842_c0_g1_i1:50-757(-)
MAQQKILFIVTSHDQLGNTGKQTGWYLPEVAHPYHVWVQHNYAIEVVSPKGGKTPVDNGSIEAFKADKVCTDFLADEKAKHLFDNSKTISQVNLSDYAAVFYPGGHGPCFDLAFDNEIASAVGKYYEAGGVVAAVCHGPVALAPIKLSNGEPLVKGKKVGGFTDKEEEMVGLDKVVPFLLETRLKEQGAVFGKADPWAPHVEVDGHLVTGQNPSSATPLAHALHDLLHKEAHKHK